MGYDTNVYRDMLCDITPDHRKTPGKYDFNENRPPCCGLRFALAPCLCLSCFVSRLAFFVVLLLPMSWTHYRTDRTTSKHQPCPLMTRPATWAHDCFCCVFVFSFFPVSFPLLYLYRMVSVTRYSKHFLGSDIDTYRQYENIAGYTEKSWYDTQ